MPTHFEKKFMTFIFHLVALPIQFIILLEQMGYGFQIPQINTQVRILWIQFFFCIFESKIIWIIFVLAYYELIYIYIVVKILIPSRKRYWSFFSEKKGKINFFYFLNYLQGKKLAIYFIKIKSFYSRKIAVKIFFIFFFSLNTSAILWIK